MSSFDTARDFRLPGVVVERVYIDPEQLSTRMRNMVKKMLRQGYTEGGWTSKSKQLARKIAEAQDLMLVSRSLHGFVAPNRNLYSDEVATKVVELLDADRALFFMEMGAAGGNDNYRRSIEARYEGSRHKVLNDTPLYSRWVNVSNTDLCDQCCEAFASMRTPQLVEAAEKACGMIDRGEPIPITISM